MLADRFTQIFRQEHRQVRDLLLELIEAFEGRDLPRARELEEGDAALTGPIVRGDVETVRAHVAGLLADAPQTLASYVALAHATLDRAVTDGRLLPIRASRMLRVLADAEAAAESAAAPADHRR